METKFNFKSQVCTSIDQSRRLLALGLKKETADCQWFLGWDDVWQMIPVDDTGVGNENIPAWSLHRLIEMCNIVIRVLRHRVSLSSGKGFSTEETLYDNLIDCIEWLIKEGYFNKEYLENGNC